ncbi:MAG: hypothetical protein GWP03_05645 [Proteobacteria bacterium]|nr:hypothetical protein [Pseudomonadota bacterium]
MTKKKSKKKLNPFYKSVIFLLFVILFMMIVSLFLRFTHLLSRKEESEAYRKSFTIDVRNACGDKGVASYFSYLLETADFDVINIGNLAKSTKMSYIVYKEGLPQRKVNLISSVTGIDSVVVDSTGTYLFDVTIVLGGNYKEKSALFIRRYSDKKERK